MPVEPVHDLEDLLRGARVMRHLYRQRARPGDHVEKEPRGHPRGDAHLPRFQHDVLLPEAFVEAALYRIGFERPDTPVAVADLQQLADLFAARCRSAALDSLDDLYELRRTGLRRLFRDPAPLEDARLRKLPVGILPVIPLLLGLTCFSCLAYSPLLLLTLRRDPASSFFSLRASAPLRLLLLFLTADR